MNFLKKNKYKVLGTVVFAVIIITAFLGGNVIAPKTLDAPKSSQTVSDELTERRTSANDETDEVPDAKAKEGLVYEEKKLKLPEEKTETESSAEHSLKTESDKGNKATNGFVCTLSVRCDTIFSNLTVLKPEKQELLPVNGIIFSETAVVFYEGESVFNILVREMKKNKIHIEFVNTPMYNTAYIKGIANIYEHDCGELSGWMYLVNGEVPQYGCSQYILRAGDKVEWVYTCNSGADVGGYYSAKGE